MKIRTKTFTNESDSDTIWDLCYFRGHVYIGLCCEFTGGKSAKLYDYDIKKDSLKMLIDMEDITGQDNNDGFASQGKIHFSLNPCLFNNKLYGATHCTTPPVNDDYWNPYAMWGDKHKRFPGSHFFEYDIVSGKTIDFGIITPNEGIPYLVFDEYRKMFYGVTYPRAHFISFDMAGKNLKDYGKISQMYPLNMIVITGKGVYFSDYHGIIKKYCYYAEDIVSTGIVIPKKPWSDGRKNWLYSSVYDNERYIYGFPYSNPELFRIDVSNDHEKLELLGNGLHEGVSQGVMRGIALSKGKVYYTVQSNSGAFLMEYDIAKSAFCSHGRLNPNKKDALCWIGESDDSGNVYFSECGRRPPRFLILSS